MEVIEIGKSQIIFVLSRDDMMKYSICTEEDTPLLRDGFCRMVNDLGMGNRFLKGVLVQIFDSKNGGCEMFVTKLADSIIGADSSSPDEKKYIYIFLTLNDLLSACKMLFESCGRGGYAFADKDKHRYFLLLDREFSYLTEFCGKYCRDSTREYLEEHCTLICDRAVETLSALA